MERNSVLTKLSLNKFVIIVFSYIIFIYYVFMAHFMLPFLDEYPIFIKTFLFLFHLSLIMFIWSILTAMLTEPGKVPQYWGFFLDESDQKKKRFCLICHIFKPDRCHHCSACNKCVLNMDHHCPWINNCIGFYNRKFFILMLFYILTTLFIVNLGMCLGIFDVIENIENFEAEYLLRIFPCITTIALFTVIGMFFKFHIYLILTNNTTIENLDRKRCPSTSHTNYDIGYYYNWVQVFGRQTFLWPFPIFAGTYGKPTGDGIIWPQLPVNRESVKNRELECSTITIENLKKTKKHENQESNDENSHGLGPKKDFSHVVRINYQKFIEEKNFENIKI